MPSTRASLWSRAARSPRTGALLLSNADRAALDASLAKDPFYVNGVAEFDVEEFHASRVAPGYENLLDSWRNRPRAEDTPVGTRAGIPCGRTRFSPRGPWR